MAGNMRFHIELEVYNADSKERLDTITEALRIAGGMLHGNALLIAGDGPPPRIVLWRESFEAGREKLTLGDVT